MRMGGYTLVILFFIAILNITKKVLAQPIGLDPSPSLESKITTAG
jgi:hypothetical protein